MIIIWGGRRRGECKIVRKAGEERSRGEEERKRRGKKRMRK